MAQPPDAYSVSAFNSRVATLLEGDEALQNIWVEGEISNLKRPDSGHVYFTLKDSQSELKAVMWKSSAARIAKLPSQGSKVRVRGKIAVYKPRGEYQIVCENLQLLGQVGDLHSQFRALWEQLEAEGLFDEDRKRPLPPFPERIGIVTSASTAALQDVLNILRRRYPYGKVYLSPTPVQGVEAPAQIVEALERIDAFGVDVILLVRGGGSLEDLWCFNNAQLARSLRQTRAPVVTGVGHETDTTLVDGTADRRAPTPSAAAEISTPNLANLRNDMAATALWLDRTLAAALNDARNTLAERARRLALRTPLAAVETYRQQLDERATQLTRAMQTGLREARQQLDNQSHALEQANPAGLLARGYAIVSAGGRPISSVSELAVGSLVDIQLADGQRQAEIKS
jgi:exodeoxyribonuclease VII large subunit